MTKELKIMVLQWINNIHDTQGWNYAVGFIDGLWMAKQISYEERHEFCKMADLNLVYSEE